MCFTPTSSLRPGGKLTAIMSASIVWHDCALPRQVRELVRSTGGNMTQLPDASFKSVGIAVATTLVTLYKL